jgi:hypothetical protein|tara:strand:+ start:580 stop:852 length:273 start_codon:yes stop_codon:yes gene_type:complete
MANGNGNGNNAMQAMADHALIKTFTPLVVAALLGLVTWLFSSLLDVQEEVAEMHIHIKHLHMAEEAFGKQMEQVETTLTDIRINVGRLVH